MAIDVKHLFVSAKADGVDSTLVQPSHWNADHMIQLDTLKLMGRSTAGHGPVEQIALDATLKFTGLTLGISDNLDIDRVYFSNAPQVSLTSINNALQIGPTSGLNLAFDGDEIQSRNNAAAGILKLNAQGGGVQIGDTPDTLLTDYFLSYAPVRIAHRELITATSVSHAFQIGDGTNPRLAMDRRTIQTFESGTGVIGNLLLQPIGGDVLIGPVGGLAGSQLISRNAAIFEQGVTIDGNVAGEAVATQAEAEAGALNTQIMTPLRVKQALNKQRQRYKSGNNTITPGAAITLAHGLGVEPDGVQVLLVCVAADAGFAVGVVMPANMNSTTLGANRMSSVRFTDTQIIVRLSDEANVFAAANGNTGVAQLLTNSAWRLRVTAWAPAP